MVETGPWLEIFLKRRIKFEKLSATWLANKEIFWIFNWLKDSNVALFSMKPKCFWLDELLEASKIYFNLQTQIFICNSQQI